MPIPQVPDRVKEAPAVALRTLFAGVGQLLLAAEKIRTRALDQVAERRGAPATDAPTPVRTDRDVQAAPAAAQAPPHSAAATPSGAGPAVAKQGATGPGGPASPDRHAKPEGRSHPVGRANGVRTPKPVGTAKPRGATGPAKRPTTAKPSSAGPPPTATPAAPPARTSKPASPPKPREQAGSAPEAGQTASEGHDIRRPPGRAGQPAKSAPGRPTKPAGKAKQPTASGPAPEGAAPIPGYDELSLPSLRARLRGLDTAAVRALLAYEKSHADREQVVTMFERRLGKLGHPWD